jgi:hypothetical protein
MQIRITYAGIGTQWLPVVVGEAARLGGLLDELVAEERGRVAGVDVGRVAQIDARATEDLLVPVQPSVTRTTQDCSRKHSLSARVIGANVVL